MVKKSLRPYFLAVWQRRGAPRKHGKATTLASTLVNWEIDGIWHCNCFEPWDQWSSVLGDDDDDDAGGADAGAEMVKVMMANKVSPITICQSLLSLKGGLSLGSFQSVSE